ncbi:MAG: transposase [Casimicrobiaceae bacterium]
MPRRRRIHVDEVPLHIVQRGHNREPCFFVDADYRAYVHWLAAALGEAQCVLHAYALMTNHVHLLVTPRHSMLVPKLVISLGRRYVQYINTKYRRTGTLWDSRYKSSLVDEEPYLLACMRYIELNPVRAGMVRDPADYQWTSYRANGLGRRDELLTRHGVYMALGNEDAARQAAYRELFRHELDREVVGDIRIALDRGNPLGNSRFREAIERALGRPCVARPRGRPRLALRDASFQDQASTDEGA